MRILACVAVLALAAVTGWCSAEEPANTRTYWVYEGGWFVKAKDGSWEELNELTYRKLGKPSKFKEAKRTKEYVELYDAKRKVAVRLAEGNAEVRVGDNADWEQLTKGRWKTPTPAE